MSSQESEPTGLAGKTSEARTAEIISTFNQVPLNQFMGLEVIEAMGGKSRARYPTTEKVQTPHGSVNGCSYYVALEIAAGAAAFSVLPDNRRAVTTDLFVSVLRSAPVNDMMEVTARVIKAGRSLVFVECEARCNDKLMATARVTKSVVEV